jgi:hypothetical protein
MSSLHFNYGAFDMTRGGGTYTPPAAWQHRYDPDFNEIVVLGGENNGTIDSSLISGAEREYNSKLDDLGTKLRKMHDARIRLTPRTPSLEQIDQVEKEIAAFPIIDRMNFAETDVKGSWGTKLNGSWDKKNYHLSFTDADNTPDLNVSIKLDDRTHIPSLLLTNHGKTGKEDDLVEISLPLTDRKLKNAEALNELLDNMPAQIKSVEVDKKHGFFKDKTILNFTGEQGDKFSLEINNGTIKNIII